MALLVLEDGIPIRPSGFCNVNGLFETFYEMSSGVEIITGPASSGMVQCNAWSNKHTLEPIESDNRFYLNAGPNNYKNFKIRASNNLDWSFDGFFALITMDLGINRVTINRK